MKDGLLSKKVILEKLNAGREDDQKISPEKLGWTLKRLGFKNARMGDKDGTRAIRYETGLVDHWKAIYDVKLPGDSNATDTPQKLTDRQTDRNEGASITPSSDGSVTLSVTGRYRQEATANSTPSTESEHDIVVRKLRGLKSAPTLDHYVNYASTIMRDETKAKSLIDQLHHDGKLAQKPDRHWAWTDT